MGGSAEGIRPDLRRELESALARLASEGHAPGQGEREITLRIDHQGRIRWFTVSRVRAPASELGRDAPPDPGSDRPEVQDQGWRVSS